MGGAPVARSGALPLRTGCQWRALPDAFPPYSTVQRHFYAWRDAGLFERINHLLVMLDRERRGEKPAPTRPSSTANRSRRARREGRRDTTAARNSWV